MDSKTAPAADWRRPTAPPTYSSSLSETAAGSRSSPLDRAGFLSFSTMSWMTPVMWSMSRKQLDFSSLSLSPLDGAHVNGDRLQTLWEQEVCAVGLQKASLTRVLLRFQGDRLLLVLVITVLFMLALFVGSGVLVHEILSYVVHPEMWSVFRGVALCLVLVFVELFRVGCLSLSWAMNLRTGIRLKAGFCMLGFNKIISLRTHTGVSLGQMVHVLTSDSYRVFEAVLLGPLVLPFPLLLIICSVYSCYILDYTALIGFFIFLIFILLQLVFARLINVYQQRASAITDTRVRTMSEVLTCIKLIKMYVWEESFERKITEIRTAERRILEKAALIQNFSVTISPLVPIIAATCTFIVHTWLGLPLSTSTAFPVVTIFNCMRFILSMSPTAVKFLAEAAVSVTRLKRLLLIENPESYVIQKTDHRSEAIIMDKATLSWTKPLHPHNTEDRDDLDNKSRHTEVMPTLRSVSFTLNKGKLLGVCGNVGSGKTSLICSLLEQMHLHQGSVSVDGSIAYTSQQAWVFYGTVQDNILMGEPLDRSRYNRVLSSCNLEADLRILPHRDQTVLGEQGVSLSGGQKQRISLARAVYSNKDIYLLDDPLSAVDAHAGKHIFEECIKKDLQGKSIILVTHQLQYMEFCDEVLVLKDGSVLETGSHLDLMKVEGHYAELITKHLKEQTTGVIQLKRGVWFVSVTIQLKRGVWCLAPPSVDDAFFSLDLTALDMTDENTDAPSPDCRAADQLIDQEEQHTSLVTLENVHQYNKAAGAADQLIDQENNTRGLVTWRTFHQYNKAAGGFCVSFFILLIFIVLITNAALSYWWLSYWLSQGHGTANVTASEQGNVSVNGDLLFYQLMFALIIVLLLSVCTLKCLCFIKITSHAATTLHNCLLRKILDSPMRFFEWNPMGRILSCFSRYQDEVDSLVPHHLNALLVFCLIAVCACVVTSVIFPIVLLPLLLLITLFALLLRMFLRNICELKKMENISRSPCISLCSSIAQGLSTIQAYNKTWQYTQLFQRLSDINANHFLLFNYAMRWLCFLVDSLCAVMALPVALLVIFSSNDIRSPPMKALALCFIVQLTSNCQYMIQSLMEVEARFISVERLLEYITGCESEGSGPVGQVDQVSEDWPQCGAITFQDYQMRYSQNSPVVLNGLQLHVSGGEKLGIVGKTGSGKSSLAAALFRLVEPAAGRILIDGVDITSISLSDLRRKLSIIPQDPVLFTGTVRYNLDPFSVHSDEEVWAALEKTYMKDTVSGLDGKLQAELTQDEGTFSAGQRQLMCLSRALLRNSKIVLLDEASASVDAETDSLIQITIRDSFQHCTTLTIAHRIHTILQVDRVLVLDHGQVIEFDHPDVLKQRPDSLFSSLLTAANTVMS
ncbi:multidrug resistance-associated protein 9-like [Seriola dumerili]|uniref:multidrug resistance-associated protein 9-like n=1 Tax=Seriola dumerili TaxID=41447 RepID=UPI000BBEDB0F|nr:multidrug resistance-associated protein 9-like [Seriola dumerili]